MGGAPVAEFDPSMGGVEVGTGPEGIADNVALLEVLG
jgi:hypothetical protein